MSAFLVGKPHIDALVGAGLRHGQKNRYAWSFYHAGEHHTLDYTTADTIGRMLWQENLKSINARYPDTIENPDNLPGPDGLTPDAMRFYTLPTKTTIMGNPLVAFTHTPIAILKAIACYEYQSCEHDGWNTSAAHAFCEALRVAMITDLPGYDEAEWEIAS